MNGSDVWGSSAPFEIGDVLALFKRNIYSEKYLVS